MTDLMGHEENTTSGTEGTPRWVGIAVVALAVVTLVSLGVGWNATTQARSASQSLAVQSKSFQQNEDALSRCVQRAPLIGELEPDGRQESAVGREDARSQRADDARHLRGVDRRRAGIRRRSDQSCDGWSARAIGAKPARRRQFGSDSGTAGRAEKSPGGPRIWQ